MKIRGIEASLSALKAHGTAVAATAHNIANLSTENFRPLDRHFIDQNPGVRVSLSRQEPQAGPPGSSGQDLAKNMVRLIGDGHVYSANLGALQQQLDLDDAVLDLVGRKQR